MGYFGKIPSLGDFFRGGGISQRFVAAWDDFLQRGFLASRDAMGADWAEAYQTAPIWRFALGKSVIDGGPFTGVMMPSQDAVGRVFPLTLVAMAAPPAGGLAEDGFYYPLEDIALMMLDSLRTKDDLEAALQAMPELEQNTPPDANTCDWLSAPAQDFGEPVALRSIGLPTPESFATLLTQDIRTWVAEPNRGGRP